MISSRVRRLQKFCHFWRSRMVLILYVDLHIQYASSVMLSPTECRGLFLLSPSPSWSQSHYHIRNIVSHPYSRMSKPYYMHPISRRCNQQIAASALLVKPSEVTRSIVQKAVVVLASKPVFGPIRCVSSHACQLFALKVRSAKLGVVTTALFNQRYSIFYYLSSPEFDLFVSDFTDSSILDDFGTSLEHSLRGQLTESGLYMGMS